MILFRRRLLNLNGDKQPKVDFDDTVKGRTCLWYCDLCKQQEELQTKRTLNST